MCSTWRLMISLVRTMRGSLTWASFSRAAAVLIGASGLRS
jgi:hypothetical protein